jgi:class 3 adenylate cyclase
MHTISKIDQLLNDYIIQNNEESRKMIEDQIWDHYGREGAIFVLDMADFSLKTKTHGIVYYLSLIKKMQQTVEPIIQNRSGQLVKFEADNVFAFFNSPENALQAGIDMKVAFEAANTKNPEDFDIFISIGIDYGKFLYLEDEHDFFGDPINIASKLGEDLARKGEILMTDHAYHLLPGIHYRSEPVEFEISGLVINSYKIFYP